MEVIYSKTFYKGCLGAIVSIIRSPDRHPKIQKKPLDFGSLETKQRDEEEGGSEKEGLPALDSGSSGDGIIQSREPILDFPPVVAGCGAKGPKLALVPQFGAVAAPESGEGPAFCAGPPRRGGGRGRDEVEGRLSVFVVRFLFTHQTMHALHDDQEQRSVW